MAFMLIKNNPICRQGLIEFLSNYGSNYESSALPLIKNRIVFENHTKEFNSIKTPEEIEGMEQALARSTNVVVG
jgi:hypothetical protein